MYYLPIHTMITHRATLLLSHVTHARCLAIVGSVMLRYARVSLVYCIFYVSAPRPLLLLLPQVIFIELLQHMPHHYSSSPSAHKLQLAYICPSCITDLCYHKSVHTKATELTANGPRHSTDATPYTHGELPYWQRLTNGASPKHLRASLLGEPICRLHSSSISTAQPLADSIG